MTTQYATPPVRLQCPVCGLDLRVDTAQGRGSKKPFIMLRCPVDGRHFRGFITSQPYVAQVLARLKDTHHQEDQL